MPEGIPFDIKPIETLLQNIIQYYQQPESVLPGHASFMHSFLC